MSKELSWTSAIVQELSEETEAGKTQKDILNKRTTALLTEFFPGKKLSICQSSISFPT